MEMWQLNILVVLSIAVITRKDMAVIAGAVMVLGYLVTLGDYSQLKASFAFLTLNGALAIIAAIYNSFKKCDLSIVTSCLATLATLTNLIQMYDPTALPSTMTAVLGWLLALALVTMDGDKGLINGFMGDARACYGRFICSLGHNNNNKGTH